MTDGRYIETLRPRKQAGTLIGLAVGWRLTALPSNRVRNFVTSRLNEVLTLLEAHQKDPPLSWFGVALHRITRSGFLENEQIKTARVRRVVGVLTNANVVVRSGHADR